MVTGVLALQGDFEARRRVLDRLGAPSCEVRTAAEIEAVDALVLPGGESTAMLRLMEDQGIAEAIAAGARKQKPILGTCAGAILLARRVTNPEQAGLGLVDMTVMRNAYGRQVDSAILPVETSLPGGAMEGVFIRAPRFLQVGPEVEVLATRAGEPVLVRQGRILAVAFHPELTADDRVHRLLLGR